MKTSQVHDLNVSERDISQYHQISVKRTCEMQCDRNVS